MPRRLAIISLVLATSFTLVACANTVRGVGRDVNATADAVQDSVN
ncbi:entericidin EcnAB [Consotaella aegiceratis]